MNTTISIFYVINKNKNKKPEESLLENEYMALTEIALSFIVFY
jgi:hypothetical protein